MAGMFGNKRKSYGKSAAEAEAVAAQALAAAQAMGSTQLASASPRTGGLFGSRSAVAAPAPTTAEAPQPAQPVAPGGQPAQGAAPFKPSFWDVLWNVGAGYSPPEARRMAERSHADDMASQQAAQERAALLGRLSPEERDLYMTDPKRWAELQMKQQEDYTLAQGAGRYGPDGRLQAYAPEVGVDGGYGYSSAPDGSINWGEQRGMSHGEAETGRHNKRLEDVSYGQLGVAQGRLGLSREAHNARLRGVGGYGTPGVGGGVIGPDLDSDWEVQ